jgi:hypothetical protein
MVVLKEKSNQQRILMGNEALGRGIVEAAGFSPLF